MSRPRSSTTSSSTSTSLRTESSRSYYASNPSALLTPASESVAIAIPSSSTGSGGPSTSSFAASQSWQSAHSLDTIRPGRARTSSQGSSDSEGSGSTNTAGPPPVVISLSSPGSPAPAQPTYHTASASSLPLPQTRQRSVSNASSVSLHLQPDLPTFIPARIRDWLLDHPIVTAGIKAALLFAVAVGSLYLLLHTLLPELDEADKGAVKMPKSFEELKALNEVLQVYKERNYWRVLGCYITVYLFLQAFSIPGSMYLSILGGAMYGVLMALPLACFCVATGALLCYLISLQLGPALLLNSEKWQRRLEAWRERIEGHREDLVSYLIVLRIAPLPPHWVVNVVAPHLGISIWHFWISTFLGIAGVSLIHTQIGTTLDQMTGTSDFHLISWQNGAGLGGIMLAVLIPVFLRRRYKKDLDDAAHVDDEVVAPLLPSPAPHLILTPPTHPGQLYQDDDDAQSIIGHASFELGSDDDDDDDEPIGKGKGKGKEVKGVASRQDGDLSKASRVLGVEVGRGKGLA